jgi:hypothetical protein
MQGCISDETSADELATEAGAYWGQSATHPWIADMSHWRGKGRWADDAAWTSIGREHLKMLDRLCAMTGRKAPIRSMLEWGPGGGANALSFASKVSRMYGVDISSPNLAECGRQLQVAGFTGWRPIEIDANRPELALAKVEEPVDFALCTAVFQHFPGKEYGSRVLAVLNHAIATNGLAIIQTRYDDGSEILRCKTSDYSKNVITFTSYRVEEFWQHLVDAGFEPLSIVLQPDPCYAYYLVKKGAGRD